MGHQNREAMAHVGVRVQRRVRLVSEVDCAGKTHGLDFRLLHLVCQSALGRLGTVVHLHF